MVSVKVCWQSSGKPAGNQRVSLTFDGLTRGVSKTEISNSQGLAHFDVSSGAGKVNVNGTCKFQGRLEGQVVVYI
jgi:hypothetical protein